MIGRRSRWLLAAAALVVPAGRALAQEPAGPAAPDSSSFELAPLLPEAPGLAPLKAVRAEVAPVDLPRLTTVERAVAPPPPIPEAVSVWKRTLELAGSLFVGSRPQTVLTTRAKASHADSTFELAADARFTYGETSQDGTSEVSQRLWQANVTLDLWPFASQSPFLLGGVESSLERRIQLRMSGGIGHKMTFVDDERSLANLSVAVLGEQSRLPGTEGRVTEVTLARLSTRLRLRRQLGERATLAHESFFRPELYQLTDFTFSNNLAATYRMNETLNLKATYLDNYDSEARDRGARTNYDGQLVLGVEADF